VGAPPEGSTLRRSETIQKGSEREKKGAERFPRVSESIVIDSGIEGEGDIIVIYQSCQKKWNLTSLVLVQLKRR